ncbi:hypothetical protein HUG20_16145 [Salicibibacter cibi]|uniref:Alcohol dehydrogenase-like C-terminal domain-containing protein n=1 Tax=Salicibibacter cibi TaxID=2743001 RepID=A0A7T7CGK4_9BACI|nr:zinc-binding dehydrogenase [Salicibibacter cibi]QQK81287.1 hypothetical protein HUG20_16145 [Salicibibacter cibi]
MELNAATFAKEKGATVIIIDGVEGRLENALKFGAAHTINFKEHETVKQREKRYLS